MKAAATQSLTLELVANHGGFANYPDNQKN
jgi:hypothetical protein